MSTSTPDVAVVHLESSEGEQDDDFDDMLLSRSFVKDTENTNKTHTDEHGTCISSTYLNRGKIEDFPPGLTLQPLVNVFYP